MKNQKKSHSTRKRFRLKNVGKHSLYLGNCLHVLRSLPDNSIDSVCTDPPYGIKLMGKKWDCDVPSIRIWRECLRVLKPGGYLVAFAGTRTQHRMATRIERAGFHIVDLLAWCYSGQATPKSMDVSKAFDRAAGVERKIVGENKNHRSGVNSKHVGTSSKFVTAATSPDAVKWDGWGTGTKPCYEPITLAQKPFKGTIIGNLKEHGTGAINIDGCRFQGTADSKSIGTKGRWPTNLLHDGSEDVDSSIPGASRFFYCAKPSKAERGEGNNHPTVKPIALMRWLCRLVTQPSGIVLDPFMGSGTTGIACSEEGMKFVGVERERSSFAIARKRVRASVRTAKPTPSKSGPKIKDVKKTHIKIG